MRYKVSKISSIFKIINLLFKKLYREQNKYFKITLKNDFFKNSPKQACSLLRELYRIPKCGRSIQEGVERGRIFPFCWIHTSRSVAAFLLLKLPAKMVNFTNSETSTQHLHMTTLIQKKKTRNIKQRTNRGGKTRDYNRQAAPGWHNMIHEAW